MGRRWWMGLVTTMAMASGCVQPAPPGCDELRRAAPVDASPAYRGFRFACANAPACPDALDCGGPRWRDLDDRQLDELAVCARAPCELRSACVREVVACER
ncbi:MAG: hypothetical protein R3B06_23640 [Kofleriaceae bacterium]